MSTLINGVANFFMNKEKTSTYAFQRVTSHHEKTGHICGYKKSSDVKDTNREETAKNKA